MRVKIKGYLDKEVQLPYSLNYPISSYLYHMITSVDRDLGQWLHHKGISYQGKTYKPIVFSNVHFEQRKNQRSYMKVKGKVWLYVDSIQNRVIQSLVKGIWDTRFLTINDVQIPIQDIQLNGKISFRNLMQYETISPILVPVQRKDKLHFCYPLESQFFDQLRRSIRNWYYLKWQQELSDEETIRVSLLDPEKFHLRRSSVLYEYKKKKLKGYHMPLEIEAPPKVQEVFYEAGAGSLSCQGWGMLRVRGGE